MAGVLLYETPSWIAETCSQQNRSENRDCPFPLAQPFIPLVTWSGSDSIFVKYWLSTAKSCRLCLIYSLLIGRLVTRSRMQSLINLRKPKRNISDICFRHSYSFFCWVPARLPPSHHLGFLKLERSWTNLLRLVIAYAGCLLSKLPHIIRGSFRCTIVIFGGYNTSPHPWNVRAPIPKSNVGSLESGSKRRLSVAIRRWDSRVEVTSLFHFLRVGVPTFALLDTASKRISVRRTRSRNQSS